MVEIKDKINLTISEASDLFGIGEKRIRQLAQTPHCDFTLYVGTKCLIRKKEFDNYLHENQFL